MRERRGQADEKLLKNHDGLSNFIANVDFKQSTRATIVPITTRGIGFLVNELCLKSRAVAPRQFIPVAALYRTALAHAELKICLANEVQQQPVAERTLQSSYMDFEMRSAILANPRHFSPIVGLVDSIGNVTHGDVKYYARIRSSSFSSHAVTLTRLREYAVNASNVLTPLISRQHAFNNESVPSAIWQYAPLGREEGAVIDAATIHLGNPNDVIVDNYTVASLRDDFLIVNDYFDGIGRKFEKKGHIFIFR